MAQEDKQYLLKYGIYTEPAETIIHHLGYQTAVVDFLDELWVETATIVAVADGSTQEAVVAAMLRLVTRPPWNPGGPTYKRHQPCIPKCDTKSEQQFNEFYHEVTNMRNQHGAWMFR